MAELDLSSLPEGCECFFTGSRIYGAPWAFSDYDLVILVSSETLEMLHDIAKRCLCCAGVGMNSKGTGRCIPCSGTGKDSTKVQKVSFGPDGKITSGSFKFDRLNIMATTSRTSFMIWKKGTQALARKSAAQGPVSREEAIAYFQEKRKKYLRKD